MERMPKSRSPRRRRPAPLPIPRRRQRHDGLTPERQLAFVEALAASGCVAEACAAAGVSRSAVYAWRVRPEAQAFRVAWDAALDLAIRALTDACYARAIQGEPIPHYFQGEQIGEHRRYDNRLAMFLLRYRDPLRYAASLDQMVYSGHPETAGLALAKARNRMLDAAHDMPSMTDDEAGAPPYSAEPIGEARERQAEDAIVASGAPVGGSHERRRRFRGLRAEHLRRTGGAEPGGDVASILSRLSADLARIPTEHDPPNGA